MTRRAAATHGRPQASRLTTRLSTSAAPRLGQRRLADDPAVAHRHDALGGARDAHVVRDEHDRLAVGVALAQHRDDLAGGGGVEVAGRLVGEQHARAVDERAGDRDALLLAAGEVAGHARAASSSSPSRSSSSAARRRASRAGTPASSAGSSTLSATVRLAIRLKNWNTKPTSLRRSRARRASLAPARRSPWTSTSPLVGRSSPPSRLSSVDLPQPLGPVTATNSPWATARSTSSSAVTAAAPVPVPLGQAGRLQHRVMSAPFRGPPRSGRAT